MPPLPTVPPSGKFWLESDRLRPKADPHFSQADLRRKKADPHFSQADLRRKKADPLFSQADLRRKKADPLFPKADLRRKKADPLSGKAGCIFRPVFPRPQSEALVRGQVPSVWERVARRKISQKRNLTPCRSFCESSPVQSWWFSPHVLPNIESQPVSRRPRGVCLFVGRCLISPCFATLCSVR